MSQYSMISRNCMPRPFRSPCPLAALLAVALASGIAGVGSAEDSSKKKVGQSESLLELSNWTRQGEWAMAGDIKGNPRKKEWKSIDEDGESILYNGKKGDTTDIISKSEYGDVEAKIVFMIPKSSNSGIYFQGRYELQILDSYGKPDEKLKHADCGGIYERWDESAPEDDKGFEGTPPNTNASKAPGSWQSFHVLFRAPRFDESGKKSENARFVRVVHNGVTIHEDVELTGPTRGGAAEEVERGPFRIQGDHGPVAIRKFHVQPMELD